MRAHFQHIRQIIHDSPSFEFLPTGELAIPQPLDAYFQNVPFLIRQQSSSAGDTSGDGDMTDLTPHSHVFL